MKQKTISLSVDWRFRDEYFKYSRYSAYSVQNILNQQADYYFGKGNWYTKKFYVEKKEGTITYLMDVESG
ncbi:MAG: hypothetical protein MRERV_16c048 [Mycoplasmataceae bacterium RV_VA103A]|nr:MAG: hypothetical protein MRERV_16c048 [Mycoplasmataceae bacterium RV_VA103A]